MFGGGGYFHEPLFDISWTLDRNIWSFNSNFIPDEYLKGNLAESWEIPDTQTIIVHIRKGVHFQDKPPANGRELTAYDYQTHYERTKRESQMFAGMLADWESITASDDHTLVFKFSRPSGQWLQAIADRGPFNCCEAPEWAALSEADRNDWRNTVGTGPWILTDFVQGSSYTYSKNPNYWGHDERHPQNQVPYADKLVSLCIPDSSTRIAALRTGKLDYLGVHQSYLNWQQAGSLAKTNPEIMQTTQPDGAAGMWFKLDKEPFTDINVRKAMNMAIDRATIAKTHYGGYAAGIPCGLISAAYKGYAFDYADWPQALKDEYTYNPTKAKQILADAGYPNGFKTNVVAATRDDMELLQIMKAEFKDIGIDMTINVLDVPTYEAMTRAGKHDQMCSASGGFTWNITRSIEQFYSKGPDAGQTNVNDPTYDELRDKFYAATDPAEAPQWVREADKRVIEQHWLVTVGEHYIFVVWQPYLKGYSGEYLFLTEHLTLARMWIDQALKK
jgi:peptide/nickel transport system substrate-binding protein